MRFLLLLLDLCLKGVRNFRKARRHSKILLANYKSLTKISISSAKFISQNCLNTLIDQCTECEFKIFNVMSI